jgi:hypothetical protein
MDVKVEVDSTGNPVWWLIGGNKWYDPTFSQLRDGAKEQRYVNFIKKSGELDIRFEFTDPSSQKGIKLSHEQFCNMFINDPVPELIYPVLMQRFAYREYKCTASAPRPASTASVPRPASSTAAATATAPTAFMPSAAAVEQIQYMGFTDLIKINDALIKTKGDINAAVELLSSESAAVAVAAMGGVTVTTTPITETIQTKYIKKLYEINEKIKELGLNDVTLKAIAQALDSTDGNVDDAVTILLSHAASSAPSASASAPSAPSASAAQLLSPKQIKQAYDATSVDLKNPDMFVANHVKTNSLLANPVYTLDTDRNLKAFAGFDGWQVVQTVGDGNCLTHAFLQCLSPTYRRIKDEGYTVKNKVAQNFREKFSQTSDLARDKNLYKAGNLTDQEILDYSRLFNVITVVFEQVNANPDVTNPIIAHNFLHTSSNQTDTVIFIHGDGGHYSSVMPSTGRFTMTLADAKKIPRLQRSLS